MSRGFIHNRQTPMPADCHNLDIQVKIKFPDFGGTTHFALQTFKVRDAYAHFMPRWRCVLCTSVFLFLRAENTDSNPLLWLRRKPH